MLSRFSLKSNNFLILFKKFTQITLFPTDTIAILARGTRDVNKKMRTALSHDYHNQIDTRILFAHQPDNPCVTTFCRCHAALLHNRVVGFAIMNQYFFQQSIVQLLMVHPHFQHMGVGTSLLCYLEHICPRKNCLSPRISPTSECSGSASSSDTRNAASSTTWIPAIRKCSSAKQENKPQPALSDAAVHRILLSIAIDSARKSTEALSASGQDRPREYTLSHWPPTRPIRLSPRPWARFRIPR